MNENDFVSHFQKNWRIKKNTDPIYPDGPDVVYRYMKQKYIDEFFATGVLKLSTYKTNREIKNDVRQDKEEGKLKYIIQSKDGRNGFELNVSDYFSQLIYCCSTKLNVKELTSYFKVDGCFEIINPLGFAFEIAKSLKAFHFGAQGQVYYCANKNVIFPLSKFPDLPDIPQQFMCDKGPTIDFIKIMDGIRKYHFSPFFFKEDKYWPEYEYRFSWKCSMHHPEKVFCPGALKYCRKIT